MAYTASPMTLLVEDVFATVRELEAATLTERQRDKLHTLAAHAAELERRRALMDTIARVGWTTYTARLARELGFTHKETA